MYNYQDLNLFLPTCWSERDRAIRLRRCESLPVQTVTHCSANSKVRPTALLWSKRILLPRHIINYRAFLPVRFTHANNTFHCPKSKTTYMSNTTWQAGALAVQSLSDADWFSCHHVTISALHRCQLLTHLSDYNMDPTQHKAVSHCCRRELWPYL
jgi:hypothetical protein